MSIRSLLSGIKPRTKTVKITPDLSVTLHEFTAATRMVIEDERHAMFERADCTAKEQNRFAAKVVAMSMLGSDPTDDDITAVTELVGLDQLDELYLESLRFGGMADAEVEDARKN